MVTADRWAVVGLGNPGPSYAGHRHNVGAMVLDVLNERHGAVFSSSTRRGVELADIVVAPGGPRARLVRPMSYMNTSGPPVQRALAYEKVPVDRLVVIHDELDLPFGSIRLKQGGGDNGHNGLKSLRSALGSGDYYRVRIGIGRPPERVRPADFVLQPFTAAERRDLPELLLDAAEAVEGILVEGLAAAQNRFHRRGG